MASWVLRVDARRGSLPTARHWARARAVEAGVPTETVPVVELLSSELVANAVVHGGTGTIEVRVHLDGDHLTVSVTDSGDEMPIVRTTGPEVPGGQGVRLVDRLSSRWGVDVLPGGGKTVWFTVPARGD